MAIKLNIFLSLFTLLLLSCDGGGSGVTGSMSRFQIVNDKFYVVSGSQLHVFDVSDAANPVKENSVKVGWDIETLTLYEGHLLIGAETGMYIYSIDDPVNPAKVSRYTHVRSCDPVVAANGYAYVTLSAFERCGGKINELHILNISDLYNPFRVNRIGMDNPLGLGIDGNTLFIADNDSGLKHYTIVGPGEIELKEQIVIPGTYDVIVYFGHLIVITEAGLYQYRYDSGNLVELSVIN
jgi:hypothetical protein